MLAYHAAMLDLGDRVLSLLACALGLPSDHFVPLFDHSVATLRPLHYRCAGGGGRCAKAAGTACWHRMAWPGAAVEAL
jgi:isopenicillin N synthase-like dioxygenase